MLLKNLGMGKEDLFLVCKNGKKWVCFQLLPHLCILNCVYIHERSVKSFCFFFFKDVLVIDAKKAGMQELGLVW